MTGGQAPATRRVDLHAHTRFSDGQLTPQALIARAVERHLVAVAVTDHDTVEGLAEAREAAAGQIEVIPGIELSCSWEGIDLHLLGFFINPDDPALGERLASLKHDRRERTRAIVQRLGSLGIQIDADQVLERSGPGVVGRPHVAQALLEAGHVRTMDEAFRRYLSPQGQAFVPKPALGPREAIALIHDADGVSVLAQPADDIGEAAADRLVGMGVRGVEVWHPRHGLAARRRWRAYATDKGLLVTGGSDFHGADRGTDLGGVAMPPGVLDSLKQAAGVAG